MPTRQKETTEDFPGGGGVAGGRDRVDLGVQRACTFYFLLLAERLVSVQDQIPSRLKLKHITGTLGSCNPPFGPESKRVIFGLWNGL
jgi:hypothetical protein